MPLKGLIQAAGSLFSKSGAQYPLSNLGKNSLSVFKTGTKSALTSAPSFLTRYFNGSTAQGQNQEPDAVQETTQSIQSTLTTTVSIARLLLLFTGPMGLVIIVVALILILFLFAQFGLSTSASSLPTTITQ